MRPDHDPLVFLDTSARKARTSAGVTQLRVGGPRPHLPKTMRVREEQRAQHPEFPLERLCTHLYEPFQLTFARHAQQLVRDQEDVELVASHQGLTVRGETEEAIEVALKSLKDFYGPQIRVSPPTVRYHHGVSLEQPWMGLRVKCRPARYEAVKTDLIVRDATIVGSEILPAVAVIQACAPLAYLIGYGPKLAALTDGSGEHVMWLSHYEPVPDDPSGGNAA